MTQGHIQTSPSGAISFVGKDAVRLFQATALASGLRLYARSGMKPNRAWTPTAMLKLASSFTGKAYKRGAYLAAAEDVKAWADAMAATLPKVRS